MTNLLIIITLAPSPIPKQIPHTLLDTISQNREKCIVIFQIPGFMETVCATVPLPHGVIKQIVHRYT